jgi:cation diffusion facilitator CzcD-associated flavoprotein CzcO
MEKASHNYQFAWEPNPDWTSMFSPSDEIRTYLEHCVTKHELGRYFKLNSRVIGAIWDEEMGRWNVRIEDTITGRTFDDWCNYLLNAGGILNAWQWPRISGLHDFKGRLVHSANWPSDFDYKNLKVAVIGNGSTGIQIVPAMQPDVKELIHLIRSPTWVTPGAASRYPSLRGGNMPETFSEEHKTLFREDPDKYLAFRKAVEIEINAKFRMLVTGAEEATRARLDASNSMIQLLRDSPHLIDKLIPDFPVGCRRITPGVGYLESFSKPNVRVITDARIDQVDGGGLLLSTGEHIEVDAIICATGFDVSFSPRFPIQGRDSIQLSDVWADPNVPQAYLSMAIPKFPNYFSKFQRQKPYPVALTRLTPPRSAFLGPNAPISHGSVFTITEQCSKYILQMITKAQVELIKTVDVKQAAVDDLAIHIHHFMPRTAWAGHCRSWFKNGRTEGPITAIHPGSRLHWFHALERPKFEDFEYTYDTGNRFQFLGNGFSTREEREADQTWYLDQVEPKLLYY